MEAANGYNPDAIFVDGTGIGWGVVDRLNQMGCRNVVGVDFGTKADRTDAAARYANKRAEMWGFMKEWLKVGSLPDDPELLADLKAVDYGYDASDAILLERKDDMRRRGLASPRPTTATRWRSPSPIRSPRRTGPRSGGSRKGSRGSSDWWDDANSTR